MGLWIPRPGFNSRSRPYRYDRMKLKKKALSLIFIGLILALSTCLIKLYLFWETIKEIPGGLFRFALLAGSVTVIIVIIALTAYLEIKIKIPVKKVLKRRKLLKEKIQLIRKKLAEFESKSLYHSFFINIITILIVILLFELVFISCTEIIIPYTAGVESSNSLYPIQVFETRIVYGVQKLLGYPVELKNNIDLYYYSPAFRKGELSMEISTPCAGIHEIVFLSALLIGFRGVRLNLKLKWIAILGSFLFVENLVRLIILYPLACWIGEEAMWYSHYIFWKYGHLLIILTLFVLWFWFVARKETKI